MDKNEKTWFVAQSEQTAGGLLNLLADATPENCHEQVVQVAFVQVAS
jgi:hypothetical protein